MIKRFFFISLAFLMVFGTIGIAQGESKRYFIKSNSEILKTLLSEQHEFEKGFTADINEKEASALLKLGFEVEELPQYHILGKPVCGDGVCQGNEVSTCSSDCSAQPPESRQCFPSAQIPYGVAMVNGGSGGNGVIVAVLDTGVKTDHLDLSVALCKDTTKRGVKNGCSDGNGHGTHVSGTIAANGGSDGLGIYGAAPDATLWMIKVCGAGGSCWSDDIATGIQYAADNGANIISMSLGSDSESSLIRDAINYAVSKGVLVVAAAGNDGPADGSIDYPGANINVVAVGAIDSSKMVPSWSSRGINDGDFIVESREVEFGAPGVAVESTWNDGCYATISGTSMATPHISALAAKLWKGSASDTRVYLQNLALNNDLHTAGDDSATGFGLPVAN